MNDAEYLAWLESSDRGPVTETLQAEKETTDD
jgi:hypothetical protein